MEPFTRLAATAIPLDEANVDTDRVIPARFLARARMEGFGPFLFHDVRIDGAGQPIASSIFNDARYKGAQILVGGANFGCGSSREAAVWALKEYGFRAVVAPSFGDIFYTNASKNGFLAVRLAEPHVRDLLAAITARPEQQLEIDLEARTVGLPGAPPHTFEIGEFERKRLLAGLDDIDATLLHRDKIDAFEAERHTRFPWSRVSLPRR